MITSRRDFLKTATLGGASLIIGFDGARLLNAATAEAVFFRPNNWIRIDSDGIVTLTIGKCEMGPGRADFVGDDLGGRTGSRLDQNQIDPGEAVGGFRSRDRWQRQHGE